MRSLPYSRQSISQADVTSVIKVLKSDFLTQGPQIGQFEKKLAKFINSKYAVVFNSGTAALHAAYFACGLKKNEEIITSPITFAATANAALYLQAKPIFSDIEKDSGNLDIEKIVSKISEKTKIVVPVHFGGLPADLQLLSSLAKKYGFFIIDDASHALGAIIKKEKIGNGKYTDMSVFSFHPIKHITTGEGGAVSTNNKEFYEKLLLFRTHGITKNKSKLINNQEGEWYQEMQLLGYNYRMTDFQAALGISQLKKIEKNIKRRQKIAYIYNQEFKKNPYFSLPPSHKSNESVYHLYPLLLKDIAKNKRKKIFENFRKKGLGVQVHYFPVYLQPYYQNLGYKKGLCPTAEDFYEREISIPLFPSMTNEDIRYTINTIKRVFKDL